MSNKQGTKYQMGHAWEGIHSPFDFYYFSNLYMYLREFLLLILIIIMLYFFPFLLLLHLPAFSEHYKIHPRNWEDISQSLEIHLLPEELDNADIHNKETGNDDGKSSIGIGTGSPPFTECGISDYEPPMASNENIQMDSLKIHNGHIVPNAEAIPWMATVWYNGTWISGELCTGSVISKWHILMAAHCIYPYYLERPWTWLKPGPWGPLETDSFPVVVGTTNFNDSSAIHHRSLRVLPHPDYRTFWFSNLWHLPYFHYANDIAIIELAESLEFSSKIRPICLSKKGVPEPQKDAIISGWGAYNDLVIHSILLRVGRNEILNASGEECQGWASKLVGFQANKSICTRDQGGTYILDGDSGSPLMIKMDNMHWTQIGIATGGYGHFGPSPPNLAAFVRVSAYCDWIEKTTSGIVKCT